ncbi:hypothetical protein [Cryobacterium soli]|uniref:hypothetical protein n=1 Tax=Cryobacterium soli TaxID=2220095 RepID=UPI000E70A679|nr:hypothetical protein [Cryobacterium soli]
MDDPIAPGLILRRALAQYISDQGMGIYRPTAPYTTGERGIYTKSTMPILAGSDNAITLKSLTPIASGRADMLYRVQVQSRIKGDATAAENMAAGLTLILDQHQNVPPGLHIAWCSLFSEMEITADSSGRCGTFQVFHFMGRRGL